MVIIIGLGNPGVQYKNTRHNIGFMAVDAFAEKNNFPEFELQKKSNALVSESIINNQKILLVKPQTFMNESGKAVQSLIRNSKLKNQNSIVIVHDDIDLPVGKIKIVQERGSAGHKGVKSIIENIGNEGLIRFRIGIAPSHSYAPEHRSEDAKNLVLKNFSEEEKEVTASAIKKTTEAIDLFISQGLEAVMNKFNSL